MPRFLALTSRGLLEPLAEEFQELGIKRPRVRPDGVEFESSWADLYRVHLHSQIASRVLLPVAEFQAYNEEDLYYGVLRKHDFTFYIAPSQTLRVEAHTRDHHKLKDQRFVAMRVKDALVDQFRNKGGERPDVGDEATADLRVVVKIVGAKVAVAVDLTGQPLSNRGYRRNVGVAPLRENVAAGLVRLAQWKAPRPLVDPFCGAGTILIEAALSTVGRASMKQGRGYAFTRLRNFQPDVWSEVGKGLTRKAAPSKPFLFGFDKDGAMVEKAIANARAAGVENWIRFQQKDMKDLVPPSGEPGVIITNPPYGERMETTPEVQRLMADFAHTLKTGFVGWDAWILSGDPEASAALRLKSARKIPVWNGPIECRFLHYPLR
ncbi:MAG: class I SAM-dependent RNA methyltransferase [Bdellovibrionales bacterium]